MVLCAYVAERRGHKSMLDAKTGYPLFTNYHSKSYHLEVQRMAETGIIKFNNVKGTEKCPIRDGDIITIEFTLRSSFDKAYPGAGGDECDEDGYWAEVPGCMFIKVPCPVPEDLGSYIAYAFSTHPQWVGMATSRVVDCNCVEYTIIRSAMELTVTSPTLGLVEQTRTQIASSSSIAHMGPGSAMWRRPEQVCISDVSKYSSPTSMFLASPGYSTIDPYPQFAGILKREQTDFGLIETNPTLNMIHKRFCHPCAEVFDFGVVMAPLEKPPGPIHTSPVVFARFMPNGQYNRVGGWRIEDISQAANVPVGMMPIHHATVYMAGQRKAWISLNNVGVYMPL